MKVFTKGINVKLISVLLGAISKGWGGLSLSPGMPVVCI